MMSGEGASGSGKGPEPDEESEGLRINDRRRIDPETGDVREPDLSNAADAAVEEAEEIVDGAAAAIAADERVVELTSDLQRLTAEYANYRKRVERDREANNELAVVAVLAQLLPVLDDIALARKNDDLDGTFKTVAESLESIVARLGLESFGAAGDAFDPAIHEAMTHTERSDDSDADAADGPVCAEIYQPGYRVKDRVVRPARVAVVE